MMIERRGMKTTEGSSSDDGPMQYSGEVPVRKDLPGTRFFAFLTFFACCIYSLTPLVSIDVWWHMRFAEYLLSNGRPVVHDPFAIQDGTRLLATYPNLIPATLFLFTFNHFSYLGLNLLRVGLFNLFILLLLYLGRHRWTGYSILLQVLVLAVAMRGKVVLQPDLFNYLLFPMWIFLLDRVVRERGASTGTFGGLAVIEVIWSNSHPFFLYYGLPIAILYLGGAIVSRWYTREGSQPQETPAVSPLLCLLAVSVIWVLNPLGLDLLQSFFIHKETGFHIAVNKPLLEALDVVDNYGYLLVFALAWAEKPWRSNVSRSVTLLRILVFVFLLIPALAYERCLPFPAIYAIVIQGTEGVVETRPSRWREALMVVVVCFSFALILERNFGFAAQWVDRMGLRQYIVHSRGIELENVNVDECIKETWLINQLAVPGGCFTNKIELASSAVWHCKDKPFFLYGHGGVMGPRMSRAMDFMGSMLAPEKARSFMDRYGIMTLIYFENNPFIMDHYDVLGSYLRLVYMDPRMAVLVAKDGISREQRQRIADFYLRYRPYVNAAAVKRDEAALLYLYLWFSAEMTGNRGDFFLKVAEDNAAPGALEGLKTRMSATIQMTRE